MSRPGPPPLTSHERLADQAHTLAILSEYTYALDTLPTELCRNFADLRELDAVLSSSMQSITQRIIRLTEMIQNNEGNKEGRLWLLTEIAEDARRLKLGGEDKIRVACQAADNLKFQSAHLQEMAKVMPNMDAAVMSRKTDYPHVGPHNFPAMHAQETGRRRKPAMASGGVLGDSSPRKPKRPRDDDEVGVRGGHHRKEKHKGKKRQERLASPAETQVSVVSFPNPISSSRGHTNKRVRNEIHYDVYNTNGFEQHVNGNAHRVPDMSGVPPAAHHPSLPSISYNGAIPYSNPRFEAASANGDWNAGPTLEGPGMPMRTNSNKSTRPAAPATPQQDPVDDPDGDGDQDGENDDGKLYCFCNRVSFGQMIGCDNQKCEKEWFHIECVGLSDVPDGGWYCDVCKAKRAAKGKGGRGGKRKGPGRGGRTAAATA
ncbi:hypothetical protein DL96DRAFT_21045 [Flagelloscypha sp. PMI_526]|nr:hypothetical protein DL96DRAFT_21045 [Flagelloscypha sp. PMI_526]